MRNTNDFVFADKLSDDELETILRDDAFKKPAFFNGSTFLFDKFAAFLRNNHHIIKINNQLHMYQDGVYIRDMSNVSSTIRTHIPNIKRNQKAEVLDCLNDIAEEKAVANARYIAFRNGIFDVESGKMQPLTPEIVTTNRIPWDYNPAASSMLVESTLNKIACGDQGRLIILPFNAVFTRDDPDFNPEIRRDILQMECIECLIRLGIEGLKRIINNKGFTRSDAAEQAAEEYSMMNNPIKGFFAEQEEDYIFRATVDEIYLAYQQYCQSIGIKPELVETKIGFGKSVAQMFKVESYLKKISGKVYRMYRNL